MDPPRQHQALAPVSTGDGARPRGWHRRSGRQGSTAQGRPPLLSLTLAMAADHLHEGIRVTAVTPGTADTPWVQRLLGAADDPTAERAALAARQPHGRLVSADEVAHAAAHLASPLSASTTGTWLAVDGGMDRLRLRPRENPAS